MLPLQLTIKFRRKSGLRGWKWTWIISAILLVMSTLILPNVEGNSGLVSSFRAQYSMSLSLLVITLFTAQNVHNSYGVPVPVSMPRILNENETRIKEYDYLDVEHFLKLIGSRLQSQSKSINNNNNTRTRTHHRSSRQLRIIASAIKNMGCLPKFFCGMNAEKKGSTVSTLNNLAYLIKFALADEGIHAKRETKDDLRGTGNLRFDPILERERSGPIPFSGYVQKMHLAPEITSHVRMREDSVPKGGFLSSIISPFKRMYVRYGRSVDSRRRKRDPDSEENDDGKGLDDLLQGEGRDDLVKGFWKTPQFKKELKLAARIGQVASELPSVEREELCTTTFNRCPYSLGEMKGMIKNEKGNDKNRDESDESEIKQKKKQKVVPRPKKPNADSAQDDAKESKKKNSNSLHAVIKNLNVMHQTKQKLSQKANPVRTTTVKSVTQRSHNVDEDDEEDDETRETSSSEEFFDKELARIGDRFDKEDLEPNNSKKTDAAKTKSGIAILTKGGPKDVDKLKKVKITSTSLGLNVLSTAEPVLKKNELKIMSESERPALEFGGLADTSVDTNRLNVPSPSSTQKSTTAGVSTEATVVKSVFRQNHVSPAPSDRPAHTTHHSVSFSGKGPVIVTETPKHISSSSFPTVEVTTGTSLTPSSEPAAKPITGTNADPKSSTSKIVVNEAGGTTPPTNSAVSISSTASTVDLSTAPIPSSTAGTTVSAFSSTQPASNPTPFVTTALPLTTINSKQKLNNAIQAMLNIMTTPSTLIVSSHKPFSQQVQQMFELDSGGQSQLSQNNSAEFGAISNQKKHDLMTGLEPPKLQGSAHFESPKPLYVVPSIHPSIRTSGILGVDLKPYETLQNADHHSSTPAPGTSTSFSTQIPTSTTIVAVQSMAFRFPPVSSTTTPQMLYDYQQSAGVPASLLLAHLSDMRNSIPNATNTQNSQSSLQAALAATNIVDTIQSTSSASPSSGSVSELAKQAELLDITTASPQPQVESMTTLHEHRHSNLYAGGHHVSDPLLRTKDSSAINLSTKPPEHLITPMEHTGTTSSVNPPTTTESHSTKTVHALYQMPYYFDSYRTKLPSLNVGMKSQGYQPTTLEATTQSTITSPVTSSITVSPKSTVKERRTTASTNNDLVPAEEDIALHEIMGDIFSSFEYQHFIQSPANEELLPQKPTKQHQPERKGEMRLRDRRPHRPTSLKAAIGKKPSNTKVTNPPSRTPSSTPLTNRSTRRPSTSPSKESLNAGGNIDQQRQNAIHMNHWNIYSSHSFGHNPTWSSSPFQTHPDEIDTTSWQYRKYSTNHNLPVKDIKSQPTSPQEHNVIANRSKPNGIKSTSFAIKKNNNKNKAEEQQKSASGHTPINPLKTPAANTGHVDLHANYYQPPPLYYTHPHQSWGDIHQPYHYQGPPPVWPPYPQAGPSPMDNTRGRVPAVNIPSQSKTETRTRQELRGKVGNVSSNHRDGVRQDRPTPLGETLIKGANLQIKSVEKQTSQTAYATGNLELQQVPTSPSRETLKRKRNKLTTSTTPAPPTTTTLTVFPKRTRTPVKPKPLKGDKTHDKNPKKDSIDSMSDEHAHKEVPPTKRTFKRQSQPPNHKSKGKPKPRTRTGHAKKSPEAYGSNRALTDSDIEKQMTEILTAIMKGLQLHTSVNLTEPTKVEQSPSSREENVPTIIHDQDPDKRPKIRTSGGHPILNKPDGNNPLFAPFMPNTQQHSVFQDWMPPLFPAPYHWSWHYPAPAFK